MEGAGATFPVAVDRQNDVGELYGFRAVPNGILINEDGSIYRRFAGGFEVRKPEMEEMVRAWLEGRKPTQEPAPREDDEPKGEALVLFRQGNALYDQGKTDEAVVLWKQAWALDPKNWVIRKQVWAVENPDRFYDGSVDYAWQREQVDQGR